MEVRGIISAIVLLAGCATATSQSEEPTSSSDEQQSGKEVEVRKEFETKLNFQIKGQQLPVPLVRAGVNGEETPLIVDSGSSHHVLSNAFVQDRGIERVGNAKKGVDHAGASVEVQPLETIEIAIGKWKLTVEDALSTEAPRAFRQLGISGFLAPQRLGKKGYAVLDFRNQTFRFFEGNSNAIVRTLKQRYETLQTLATRKDGQFYVDVALEDGNAVAAKLNTGGTHTEFERDVLSNGRPKTRTDGSGSECEGGMAVSGKCVEAGTLPGANVQFAGKNHSVDGVKIVESIGEDDSQISAQVGMDVLRGCLVAFPQTEEAPLLATCQSEEE